nr:hypothetical protein BaRGS_003651 [Batillaria attramentaria]
MGKNELVAKVISTVLGLAASFTITYFGVRWLVNAMDPTRKEKEEAQKRLSEYELCIASNLVDPVSMEISWQDIGGLEDVIRDIKETVILPFQKAHLFRHSSLLQPPKDSFLRSRTSTDHEATAMIKTQFMSFWDGLMTDPSCHVMVMGATNRPQDVDAAILRRMPSMFYIVFHQQVAALDFDRLAELTEGFSGSDLREVCRSAAVSTVHEYLAQWRQQEGDEEEEDELRCLTMADMETAIAKVKDAKSVSRGNPAFINLD